jgi:galactitol-specific phosphotransferase system IIC component
MKSLFDTICKRRLYVTACFAILGLQICAYLVLLVLWSTSALDRHLFSLSHLSLVSQVVSATSQALAISLLAALTFFAQVVASDKIIRQRMCARDCCQLETIMSVIS